MLGFNRMKNFTLANIAGWIAGLIILKLFWFTGPSPSEDHPKLNGRTTFEVFVTELGRDDSNATGLIDWLPGIIGSFGLAFGVGYFVWKFFLVIGRVIKKDEPEYIG